MSNLMKWMAGLIIAITSVSMADLTLDFANSNPDRDFSGSGDSITLDFSIDGSGAVSMVATAVGSGTDPEYLAAVNSWTGPVGTVEDAALFGETFQMTILVTLVDRTNGVTIGTERISVDGNYLDGIMGCGGGNGSRVDWTTGAQEWLHFEQTGGSAVINLLDFEWHGASTSLNLWDTQLIAGGVSNRWMNLPGNTGTVDVSALGYVIGSGTNELTIAQPLDGSHGLGVAGMTLRIAAPSGSLAPLVATFDSGTGNLTISWSGPGQLQETPDLTSPIVWTNVPGVVGTSHVIAVGGGTQQAFYRLKLDETNDGIHEIVPSGTPDDADLIQDALDQLQDGETLKLTGDFVIKKTIYLPSNFSWILNGSLSLTNGVDLDSVGYVDPSRGIDARRPTAITEKPGGATNIDMSGGVYYGFDVHNGSATIRFLNFVSVTNSYFHDFTVNEGSDDGFTLGPECNNNECRNLVGSGAHGNALTDKGDHNKWYDCIAEDCDSDGWTPKCRYSEFYRCIGRRNGGPGFGMYCRIDGSGNPVDLGEAIEGNKFYDCQAYENNAAGFSFNISSTSGEGGSIRSNYVEAVCYGNKSSGVRFRNKMPNSIVADNEINIVCWGNQGLTSGGSLSSVAGGLGTDAGTYPITGITGTMVSFDNIQWDVNTGQASDCDITVYHPAGENAPVLKTGDPSNNITVIGFDCSDPLSEWCMQAYCNSVSP